MRFRRPKYKGLSDKDLRWVCFFIGVSLFLMFARFGSREYGSWSEESRLTNTNFSSMLVPDVLVSFAGWLAVALFIYNLPKINNYGYK